MISFAHSGQIGSLSGYSMQSTHSILLHATHSITWFEQKSSAQNGHSTASSSRISVSHMEHCTAMGRHSDRIKDSALRKASLSSFTSGPLASHQDYPW
jgi:hypothetical protein